MFPVPSTPMPPGQLNCPGPLPIVLEKVRSLFRTWIRWLPVSHTYTFWLVGLKAIAQGSRSCSCPLPFDPTEVINLPSRVNLFTQCSAATSTVLSLQRVTPRGLDSLLSPVPVCPKDRSLCPALSYTEIQLASLSATTSSPLVGVAHVPRKTGRPEQLWQMGEKYGGTRLG